jgi:hypothetical protein
MFNLKKSLLLAVLFVLGVHIGATNKENPYRKENSGADAAARTINILAKKNKLLGRSQTGTNTERALQKAGAQRTLKVAGRRRSARHR